MGFYKFIRGASGLGIGVENLALAKSQSDPLLAPYTSRNRVDRQLKTARPAFDMQGQRFVTVPLLGQGAIALSGSVALTALIEFQKGS